MNEQAQQTAPVGWYVPTPARRLAAEVPVDEWAYVDLDEYDLRDGELQRATLLFHPGAHDGEDAFLAALDYAVARWALRHPDELQKAVEKLEWAERRRRADAEWDAARGAWLQPKTRPNWRIAHPLPAGDSWRASAWGAHGWDDDADVD